MARGRVVWLKYLQESDLTNRRFVADRFDRQPQRHPMLKSWACLLRQFLADEQGPTAVEYAVMLAMIIIAGIGAVLMLGDFQRLLFQGNADLISDAIQP